MARMSLRLTWLLLAAGLFGLFGCATQVDKKQFNEAAAESFAGEPDFKPVEPMEDYSFNVLVKNVKNGEGIWQTLYWADLSKNNDLINTYLPNHNASVVVIKKDESGSLKFLTATLSGDAGSYRVLMDYMKYRIEPIYSDANEAGKQEYLGTGKVGVGLRISADVVTYKTGVDLGSLLALGVAASQGYLKGSLSVDVIGIDSKDVTNLIPLNAVIDESSIQQALQALASIKTKLHDKDVILTPHVIAVRSANSANKNILLKSTKLPNTP